MFSGDSWMKKYSYGGASSGVRRWPPEYLVKCDDILMLFIYTFFLFEI